MYSKISYFGNLIVFNDRKSVLKRETLDSPGFSPDPRLAGKKNADRIPASRGFPLKTIGSRYF